MKLFLTLVLFIISTTASAYVDLNLSYTLSQRKIEGVRTDPDVDTGSAQTTSTGASVNWAWFIWEYTALELNYSSTTQRLLDDREVSTDDASITIKEVDSKTITQVSGVGIRQAFASRKSSIIPTLAFGYAKYTTSGLTKYTLDNSGTETELEILQDKEAFSSSYASFSLRFRFTKLMGVTIAAKTVMPNFETDKASNNVTYSAGLSWMF